MKFSTSAGSPLPFGASRHPEGGYNFTLFSRHAESVSLVLFSPGSNEILAELPFDQKINRTGDVWHLHVREFAHPLRYGYRLDGPNDPTGSGHFFDPKQILIDPYARALTGGHNWGACSYRVGGDPAARAYLRRCIVEAEDGFDWQGDRPLGIPLSETIIYEMHVRGFTRHPSSEVACPGTYQGVVDKIPYLKQLGVTAVELMPVMEFNENEMAYSDPVSGDPLKNFWGYSPIAFFAPKASYAVWGCNGNQVREFKEMVRALHAAGIEVILDVVFNHTSEAGGDGPMLSFRGLDNTIYYLLDPKTRDYLNFSGCGNTMNCNHPVVRELILDCLRYWVIEMHVDGFRFDLASVLGRDRQGNVLANPPMVERIAEDPVLAGSKIIAEAWDAAGLYQVGSFSTSIRWAEWNGRFRDDVRGFLRGDPGSVPALATRIAGSSDLYQASGRSPSNSINFVTSHDGFPLADLVSYNHKHNEANGEENRDGDNHNLSWNSGVEGKTADEAVQALRFRRIRSFAAILFLSQGVPMLAAGDEFGRSQGGNNNAYCQDNEISWLDWRLAETNADLVRFFRLLIGLRKRHPVFHRRRFFREAGSAQPEIRWQSASGEENWSPSCTTLAFLLDGRGTRDGRRDDDFFVMLNGGQGSELFVVPPPPNGRRWRRVVDTAAPSPRDIVEEKAAPLVSSRRCRVASFGAVVLVARPFAAKERR